MIKISDIENPDLKETLSLFNKVVLANTTLETSEDIKKINQTGFLYHINIESIKTFIPNVSRRGALTEDNTVPRIHTGIDLLGCLRGYASLFTEYLDLNSPGGFDKKIRGKNYFYFNVFDFEYCLKPNNELVYDTSYTKERWLFAFDKNTKYYKPLATFEIIYRSVNLKRYSGELVLDIVFNINNDTDLDISIDAKEEKVISKGIYDIHLQYTKKSINNEEYKILEITKVNDKASLEDLGMPYSKW